MEEENEYKKLPTEEKCVHKLWKARLTGYEEAMKLFNQIDDEKSPEWSKYLGLIKKFVTDSNAVAQEKGLEAALVFVENCGHAGKTTGEVMAGIVAKCIAAPKTKTKDLALQITLMYVEIEKQEIVQEELMKGMENKNPKVVAACIVAMNSALKQFGNKVITIKPMVKKIPILLSDRDKTVRDEMKALVVEMHRWIGPAIEPHIASLQAVIQQELRESFGSGGAPRPTRLLRSQQSRDAPQADVADGVPDDEDTDVADRDPGDQDPFEFMDPVEILSKLPKDFYDKLEQKKWQERKEALDALDNLLKTAPRLEPGDYADLVRALKKIISKDSNVLLVALAGRQLGQIAAGLRNKFQPYAVACVQAILEKFKEKKANVVVALREAIDAIYPSTNLEAIMEDMLAAFENKNPTIKAESSLFLARALCVTQPQAFNKKLLKAYVAGLLKLIESADPTVRDAAAEALGTATKLVGEKNIAPHIGKIDPLKEQKIKECAEKVCLKFKMEKIPVEAKPTYAVIQVKTAAPKKEAKKTTPAAKGDAKPSAGSTKPKPVVRKTGPAKKAVGGVKKGRPQPSPPREQELTQEEVDMKADDLLPPDVAAGLTDSNWKSRLTAVQNFLQVVQGLKPEEATSQLLFRILNKKPGLKDTNVQVLKARLEAAKYIAENFPMTTTSVDSIIQDIVTKLGEAACSNVCGAFLFAACEACGLEYVTGEAMTYAMDSQKNPKVQAELLNWLANALKEFGNIININSVIPHLKKALSATNPNVRTAAVNFVGVMSLYTGPCLINHFDGEKPATKQLLSLEIDKYANSTPPTPTRQAAGKIAKSASKGSVGTDDVEEDEEVLEDEPVVEDNRPRTDIAPLITDALVLEMNDKNWKVRNEALDKLKAIITNSAPIKPSLGELPPALQLRLADSNSKLVQLAIQICENLATAMGTKCKQHVRTFFPAFFLAFGDSKQWIRTAAVGCVDTWCREAGGAQVALEGEMVADALKAGSPVVRAILLNWLVVTLPNVPPKSFNRDELIACVPTLFACVEDRSADVRKAASDCVLPYMLHLGYEGMFKHLDKLKPGSKSVVQAVLDKARPSLPVQPLPPSKGRKEEVRGVKSAGALKKEGDKKGAAQRSKTPIKPASPASRGKKDDEDFSPLLPVNNAKNQRIIDDQKLKVLKWNFTQPRDEFNELLKEQMTSAGLNKQLMANMFHSDFRYHLKAIESLSDDLHDNGPALMANLDLVLKWLTLRFFDTNPSVILKGLEYLSVVFQRLTESDYTMPEYEANCFIPYLVLKVGDPKDTVRHAVKALFKQICVVYSVTKLFGYLMEGLKSKNARQRAECLECIGHLLETYGSSIMSPSATVALKELARHIGDRDNAVRSAALNCVSNAYFLEGEKIYKMIGQIADKDLSLLEERIKRAGKSRSAMLRRPIVPLTPAGRPIQPPIEDETPKRSSSAESLPGVDEEDRDRKEDHEDEPMSPEIFAVPEPRVVTGPFGLDPELIARLDSQVPKLRSYDLPEPDLKFLEESVPVLNIVASLRHNLQLAPRHGNPVSIISPPQHQHSTDDSHLADTIHSIGSPDLNVAIRALSLISGTMVSGTGAGLAAHEERLVCAIASQVRRLRTTTNDLRDALPPLKCVAQVLTTFYETGGCGSHVGAVGVGQLLGELLQVLGGCASITGPEADRFVRVLNNVCVRLLERSPRTALVSAIVTLLQESIGVTDPASPRYQDLLLKCFWKTLKTMVNWELNTLDYDTVLYKIHLFYKAHPNSFWKKHTSLSDTPYRTIKTLVHTLVKMKGMSIMNHLTLIPDVNESDLHSYLLKVLKQMKLDEKKENNNAGPSDGSVLTAAPTNQALSAGRLPRSVHDELALILKRIGSKEHNTDALQQLFDLRERHPEVDIWTFMQGSSFYFRNYVERGLREVAEQRRLATVPHYKRDFTNETVDINNENEDTSHVIFLERLRALQAKAGLKSEPATPQRATVDNRPLADSGADNSIRTRSIDPQFDLNATHSISSKNEADVEALRLKLQQIRSNSRR